MLDRFPFAHAAIVALAVLLAGLIGALVQLWIGKPVGDLAFVSVGCYALALGAVTWHYCRLGRARAARGQQPLRLVFLRCLGWLTVVLIGVPLAHLVLVGQPAPEWTHTVLSLSAALPWIAYNTARQQWPAPKLGDEKRGAA